MQRIHLGRFLLDYPLGRGGMAEVWAGEHTSGTPVAVKLLPGRVDPEFAARFRVEVRAIATLDHPNVVRVLDAGTVDPEAALASAGRLRAGTPWLAMERAEGGTLSEAARSMDWGGLHGVLLDLLAALGHAHAHSVLHRDVKPGNVLLGGLTPGWKLSDFGIAHMFAEEGPDPISAGTRRYMPPEQRAARFRDCGPWSDLFAIGVLCWRVVTGRYPYPQDWKPDLAPFAPRMPVPHELQPWLQRLLEPDPAKRFRRATDAAHVLRAMSPVASEPRPVPAGLAELPTASLSEVETLTLPPGAGWIGSGTRDHAPIAPMPAEPPPRPSTPGITGLGLYGLRPAPFVGREAERRQLWDALHAARRERHLQAVVLRGTAGVGKSRLAAELCADAHASAGALVLRGSGVEEMLQRFLGGRVLETAAAWGLGEDDALALTTPDNPREWHAAIDELLRCVLCGSGPDAGRPAVLWFDDAPWSLDVLPLVEHLLGRPEGLPVLILLTASDGASPPLLARLPAIDLAPLDEATSITLVRGLVAGSADLAEAIGRASRGLPVFAVQTVGEYVERGALEESGLSLRLRPDAAVEVPADLAALWTSRRAALPGEGAAALEVAATLGVRVDGAEWRAACVEARAALPAGFAEVLVDRGLATAETDPEQAWAFVHASLRDQVLDGARPRVGELHAACARALRGLGAAPERIAAHLSEAGADEEALPLLLQAIEGWIDDDQQRAAELIERFHEAAARCGLGPDDRRVLTAEELSAYVARASGRHPEALAAARDVAERARAAGHATVVVRALMVQVHAGLWLLSPEALVPVATEMVTEAERLGDDVAIVDATRTMAMAWLNAGDEARAEAWLARALEAAERCGRDDLRGEVHFLAAQLYVEAGEIRRAHEHIVRIPELARGRPLSIASARLVEARILRRERRLEEAEALLESVRPRLARVGSGYAVVAAHELGWVALELAQYDRALVILDEALRAARAAGLTAIEPEIVVALLTAAARAANGPSYDRAIRELGPLRGRSAPEMEKLLEQAAERWAELGDTARAHAALDLVSPRS